MYQPDPSGGQPAEPERASCSRAGAARRPFLLPAGPSSCPDRCKGRRDGGLAIVCSTVYNVGMAVRAMQEATFLILTALADGSQHGYGIITDVQDISGGGIRLRPGTLYTALDRLSADELIAVDREEVVDGRLRRYYRLTPAGTRRLAVEAARLQAHAAAALRRLNLAGGMAT
jgi:DNA-binding PadR family transcriptional regulator